MPITFSVYFIRIKITKIHALGPSPENLPVCIEQHHLWKTKFECLPTDILCYALNYYTTTRMKKLLLHLATWMNLINIMFNEGSHTHTLPQNSYFMIPFT